MSIELHYKARWQWPPSVATTFWWRPWRTSTNRGATSPMVPPFFWELKWHLFFFRHHFKQKKKSSSNFQIFRGNKNLSFPRWRPWDFKVVKSWAMGLRLSGSLLRVSSFGSTTQSFSSYTKLEAFPVVGYFWDCMCVFVYTFIFFQNIYVYLCRYIFLYCMNTSVIMYIYTCNCSV